MDSFDTGRMAFLCGTPEEANPYMRSNATLHAARNWHRGWLYERDELAEVRYEASHATR
jgi:hypothetical protein